jgi:hypothetical protein
MHINSHYFLPNSTRVKDLPMYGKLSSVAVCYSFNLFNSAPTEIDNTLDAHSIRLYILLLIPFRHDSRHFYVAQLAIRKRARKSIMFIAVRALYVHYTSPPHIIIWISYNRLAILL